MSIGYTGLSKGNLELATVIATHWQMVLLLLVFYLKAAEHIRRYFGGELSPTFINDETPVQNRKSTPVKL